MDASKEFIVPCDCGHSVLRVSLYSDKHEKWATIDTYISTFYTRTFIERLKMAWLMLIGKEYRYFDIFLQEDKWNEFVKFMSSFEEKNVG